jgi:membrane protein DedA with SNARE-associated domain
VFLEQIGAPIPAVPTLIVAGALVANGDLTLGSVVLAILAASLLSDMAWYVVGRRHGRKVLEKLCRLSMSPSTCVRQTESLYARFGPWSLLFAKFIPGYSQVAPPLAGALRVKPLHFAAWSGAGALAWGGLAVGVGYAFHDTVERAAEWLATLGGYALLLLASVFVIFIAAKWWRRRRFMQVLRMERISPAELKELMDRGDAPLVFDVRSAWAQRDDLRRIPGARVLDLDRLADALAGEPPEREVVLYCT